MYINFKYQFSGISERLILNLKRESIFTSKGKKIPLHRNHFLIFICFLSLLTSVGLNFTNAQAASIVNIQEGDEWHYMKGAQLPPRKWHGSDFDQSSWQKGLSGFGYGSPNIKTLLGDMQGNYLSVYTRREFTVNNPGSVRDINVSVLCDGPFIVFLNDLELLRTKTIQVQSEGLQQAEQYNMNGFIHELNRGKNIISFQCDNDDISSDDFTFIPVFEVLEFEGDQQ